MPRKPLIAVVLLMGLLSGCASRDFATSPTPATVEGYHKAQSVLFWDSVRLYRVGSVDFGLSHASHAPVNVNPGETTVQVIYMGNRGRAPGIDASFVRQTDPVSFNVVLKPGGRYQVLAEPGETTVRFRLIEQDTNTVLASSSQVPVMWRPLPRPERQTVTIPVIIPSR